MGRLIYKFWISKWRVLLLSITTCTVRCNPTCESNRWAPQEPWSLQHHNKNIFSYFMNTWAVSNCSFQQEWWCEIQRRLLPKFQLQTFSNFCVVHKKGKQNHQRDVLSKSMFGVGSRPTQISEKRYVQSNVEKINVVWLNNLMFWFPEGF